MYRSAYSSRSTPCFSKEIVGEALGVLQRVSRIASRPRAYASRKSRLHGEIATLSRLGALEVASVGSRLVRESWPVPERHHLYAADALQIVTARDQTCDHFLTRDGNLRAAAKAEGLDVLDPAGDAARIRQLA